MITLPISMRRPNRERTISAQFANTVTRETTRTVAKPKGGVPATRKPASGTLKERIDGKGVTGGVGSLGTLLSRLFSVTPYKPVAPFKPTAIVTPVNSQPVTKMNFGGAIKSRVSAGGAPPPATSEKTVHWSVNEWNKQVNSIPPEQRSVSPRQVAMAPRMDQSSPTLYQGPNAVAIHLASKAPSENKSAGIQEDNTPKPDNAMLYFVGIALFGYLLLIRGR